MKNINAALQNHLDSEVTTLATCWKLTRTDNMVMGFTDHDQDLVVNSVTYVASSGFTPTALASDDRMGVDAFAVEGVLDSNLIAEQDIIAGLYDFAQVNVFIVNYEDPTQGSIQLRTGWLGEVRMGRERFEAELDGLMQKLDKAVGQLYSPLCRAKLGDGQCGINMAGYTVTGTLTGVMDNRVFQDSSRAEAAGYFSAGKISFTSGNNNGLSMEVKEYTADGTIKLVLPMPYTVQSGDDYTMEAGCDKRFETCKGTFSNGINFRGEPHIPGTDKMLETSSTRN